MHSSEGTIAWHEVLEEHWDDWNVIFKNSRESLDLQSECPECHKTTLHQWFDGTNYTPQKLGAVWEWCSNCGACSHGSAIVPNWWKPQNDFNPDLSQIRIIPWVIEDQRVQWKKNKTLNDN
jgi:hypothetical protein